MENILAQAKRVAEEAEVFTISSEETPIHFEANRLKQVERRQSTTVALRIVRQGKLGYATVTQLNDAPNLVNMAAETAQFGMTAKFEFPVSTLYPSVNIFDPDVESWPLEKMVELGEKLVTTLRNHTPDLLCHVWVTKGVTTIRIINSRGGQASYQQT